MAGPDGVVGALADLLLVREAVRARLHRDTTGDPLAGLRIDEAEVERLVGELSGDRSAPRKDPLARFEPALRDARAAFVQHLLAGDLFAGTCRRAGLTPVEAEVFAVLAAVELDPRRQRLLAFVQDDVTKVRPTLATLRRMFGSPGVLAVSPAGRLRRAALVSLDDGTAWGAQTVTLCPPVTWALIGDASLDPDLPPDTAVHNIGGEPDGAACVLVAGDDRVRRLARAFEALAGTAYLVTPAPAGAAGWEAIIREATVGGLGVVLELEDAVTPETRWWVERASHLPWGIVSRSELPLDELPSCPWVEVRAADPEPSDDEWRVAFGDGFERHGHRLTAEQLRLVRIAADLGDVAFDDAVRRLASGPLDKLARRIRPRRTWDDLVLSDERVGQLKELTARYRHRDTVYGEWGFPGFPSTGLVALFSGQSGTGKTLAAEIVAGDLGLDLYKLDLSSVVSKYIGETEKNLEKVFSAASAGNLVLFFDEADSLFGKRSEVTDARDRYANIEVSYLLQRLEAYDGLVVMATNFQKNIDDAFLRRIHVGIDFPMPEEPERMAIWKHGFPPGAPTKDLDWEFLAGQFKLAGGNIKGAALHSAFLAAEAGTPITMELVMLALKREFQKLGRLRTQADFGRYTELVNG